MTKRPHPGDGDGSRGGQTAENPPVALGRRYVAEELAFAEGDANAVGPRVVRPDEQDDEKDPAPLGAQLGRRHAGG